MNNVVVYAVAQKYDIPELKELAKERLTKSLREGGLMADLPSIVDAIYETTPSTEVGLRNVATAFCKDSIEEI